MAVYPITKELNSFLRHCPKQHKRNGKIIEWTGYDQLDGSVKKDFRKIISNFSNLVWGYKNYNPVKEKISDPKYIKSIYEIICGEKDSYDEDTRFLLSNELSALNLPSENSLEINLSQLLRLLHPNFNFSLSKGNLIITPINSIRENIKFTEERIMGSAKDYNYKLSIDDKEIKLNPRLFTLYKFIYMNKETGLTTYDIRNSEEKLNNLYEEIKQSKTKKFYDGKNPKKDIIDTINRINTELQQQKVKPHYCIKHIIENENGGIFNIAIYEINRALCKE